MSLFVTGTDTGVGKTHVAAALVRTLRAEGRDAVACKPVCCGGRGDAEILAEASGGLPLDRVNPFHFEMPLAPASAAMLDGREIDAEALIDACRRMMREHETVIFEGIGGWEVPIGPGLRVSGMAARIGVPVVVVVANRLGALNHALLTVEAVRRTRTPEGRLLPCEGIVVNEQKEELGLPEITNLAMLREIAGVPMLAHVIHGQRELRLEPEPEIKLAAEAEG